jgi:hypothetical protein
MGAPTLAGRRGVDDENEQRDLRKSALILRPKDLSNSRVALAEKAKRRAEIRRGVLVFTWGSRRL